MYIYGETWVLIMKTNKFLDIRETIKSTQTKREERKGHLRQEIISII